MIVRMRSPGITEIAAHLRDTNRTAHRPEMGIRKDNIDGFLGFDACQACQSVAIILVAVGNPDFLLNSLMISRPE